MKTKVRGAAHYFRGKSSQLSFRHHRVQPSSRTPSVGSPSSPSFQRIIRPASKRERGKFMIVFPVRSSCGISILCSLCIIIAPSSKSSQTRGSTFRRPSDVSVVPGEEEEAECTKTHKICHITLVLPCLLACLLADVDYKECVLEQILASSLGFFSGRCRRSIIVPYFKQSDFFSCWSMLPLPPPPTL